MSHNNARMTLDNNRVFVMPTLLLSVVLSLQFCFLLLIASEDVHYSLSLCLDIIKLMLLCTVAFMPRKYFIRRVIFDYHR